MNFGESIKKELLLRPIKERHCKKAFLCGILRGAGALYSGDSEIGLLVRLSDEDVAMTVSSLLSYLYDYEIREITVEEDKLNKKDKFTLFLSGDKAPQSSPGGAAPGSRQSCSPARNRCRSFCLWRGICVR